MSTRVTDISPVLKPFLAWLATQDDDRLILDPRVRAAFVAGYVARDAEITRAEIVRLEGSRRRLVIVATDDLCTCGHTWGEHCRYGCAIPNGSGDICPCQHFIAADREGFDCIGIDSDIHAIDITERRLRMDAPLLATDVVKQAEQYATLALFDSMESDLIARNGEAL